MQFVKLPKSLLSDEKYKGLCLEAKVLYSLMLDRLSLSEKNGWRDERGEAFIIYTQKSAAKNLRVSEKSISKYVSQLKKAGLIYSLKPGFGKPEIFYLNTHYFFSGDEKKVPLAPENISGTHPKNFPPNNTDINKTDNNHTYQSETGGGRDPLLCKILDRCELEIWDEEIADTIEHAIEDVYYSPSLNVCGRVLDRDQLISRLLRLTGDSVIYAVDSLRENSAGVKNPHSYLMSALVNAPDNYKLECMV